MRENKKRRAHYPRTVNHTNQDRAPRKQRIIFAWPNGKQWDEIGSHKKITVGDLPMKEKAYDGPPNNEMWSCLSTGKILNTKPTKCLGR